MSIFTSFNLRSFLLFWVLLLGSFMILSAEEVPSGLVKVSYYADYFTGQKTANGEYYKPDEYTCAHTFYPFGTLLKLKKGKRAVIVRVNDRGPFVGNRVLDLSYVAAKDLGIVNAGVADVSMELFDPTFYDTSDTILLAKVLSPDDKRFKLAMNVAKIEREAKNKEKIAELDAKHAAKKGKKDKKEGKGKAEKVDKKGISKKMDKKEANLDKADKKGIAKKSDKKEKTDKTADKKAEMSTKKKELGAKEKKELKDSISKKVKKNTNLDKELTEKGKVNRDKKDQKAEKNIEIAAINTLNSIDEQKITEKEKKTLNLSSKNLEDSIKGFNFASDISSVPHTKTSNWWIFPWIVVIVGTVFGLIIKNRH
jgi:rare lipoprotein A